MSFTGAPISAVIAAASSGDRRLYTSEIFRSSADRSRGPVRDHVGKADFAAATARSTSSALTSVTRAMVRSVAGSTTSALVVEIGSIHFPSM